MRSTTFEFGPTPLEADKWLVRWIRGSMNQWENVYVDHSTYRLLQHAFDGGQTALRTQFRELMENR